MSREVPEGWTLEPLQSLFSLHTPGFWGQEPNGSCDVKVLRATNLTKDNKLDLSRPALRSFPEKKLGQKALKFGDIILERSGGSPSQPVGRVGFFDGGPGYSASNFMQIMRAETNICAPRFCYFLMAWLYDTGVTEKLQKATTGIRNLDYSTYLQTEIIVPQLHEQRRIAEILSSVDDAIAATRAVIEQTRKVKQGVLERLLTKGIGHTRFKQTEVGDIPEGWEIKPVDDLCVLSNGNGFRPRDWSDAGLPIIRIQNLNGSQNFNYFNGTPLEKWLVHPGDLLFAWAGVRGVSFGPTIWAGPLGVLNQHIFKFSCREQVDRLWLFHMMKLITSRIEAKAHGFKDSLLHVHKKEITGQLVPVPSLAEQVQISARMAEIQSAEDLATSSLQRLLSTKSALTSDLLSGRKRVTDALPLAAE